LEPSSDCFLIVLDGLKDQPKTQGLFKIVYQLARIAYFYDDLREFNQVHVDYFAAEDDHRDLQYSPILTLFRGYDFARDSLAKKRQGRTHFLLERALRMRKACARFNDDPQRCSDRLDNADLRRFRSDLKEYQDLMEAFRVIEIVIEKGFKVLIACDLHISLILALFALLNPKRLPANCLYSLTAGKDMQYIQERIVGEHHLRIVKVCEQMDPDSVTLREILSFFK
jgi:hypothetical protein